jgi:hypothetical protein
LLAGAGPCRQSHYSSTISNSEQNKNKGGNSSPAIQGFRLHLSPISTLTETVVAASGDGRAKAETFIGAVAATRRNA